MNELIIATGNAGKLKEFQQLLSPIHCIAQSTLNIESVEENGLSFIENALLKARHASSLAGKPALADDSGLVVPALNGAPGIFSARYSGDYANDKSNIEFLIKNMADLNKEQRHAYFYCAIALVRHAKDPTPLIATGVFHGYINESPAGDGGFGYDPVFYLPEYQCTVAELPAGIKNSISHRAQALNTLRSLLTEFK
ncbi:MAG TPA: RdgB/HAM1 family non-canonical purine NTP pyrophosphatase [Legionella sp.]|nr:RdgB/HAM1 family non-canonical purine NTP pyrophosphatase [Legionella sp.]